MALRDERAELGEYVKEREKLREEQRSAIAIDYFIGLSTTAKRPSVVCAQGDHGACLLIECTCDCHRQTSEEVG